MPGVTRQERNSIREHGQRENFSSTQDYCVLSKTLFLYCPNPLKPCSFKKGHSMFRQPARCSRLVDCVGYWIECSGKCVNLRTIYFFHRANHQWLICGSAAIGCRYVPRPLALVLNRFASFNKSRLAAHHAEFKRPEWY